MGASLLAMTYSVATTLRDADGTPTIVLALAAQSRISLLLRSNSGEVPLVGRSYTIQLTDGSTLQGTTGDDGLVEHSPVIGGDHSLTIDGVTVPIPSHSASLEKVAWRVDGYYLSTVDS
ncbi:MAG TPA: hypothetical protein VIF09_28650 [Polyangiaceae bacterium]